MQYIFDYETLVLDPDNFKKRKRIKNSIPNYERCCALRCDNDRCTRKKKKNEYFCGTHSKGTPYGTIEDIGKTIMSLKLLYGWKKSMVFINISMNMEMCIPPKI